MTKHLPSTQSLRAFEAAARRGSFSDASEELALSQSTVSYQVQQLEGLIGAPLFLRANRRIQLTEAGEKLLPLARRILGDLRDTVGLLREAAAATIRMHVTTYFAVRWLSPRLAKWQVENPAIQVVLLHEQTLEAESQADIVIAWGRGDWPDRQVSRLTVSHMVPHCSPALAAQLREEADVAQHCLIREAIAQDLWRDWFEAAGLSFPGEPRQMIIADPNVRLQAACDGLGLVIADQLAEQERARGALVAPFSISAGEMGYFALTCRDSSRQVQSLIDWLVASA